MAPKSLTPNLRFSLEELYKLWQPFFMLNCVTLTIYKCLAVALQTAANHDFSYFGPSTILREQSVTALIFIQSGNFYSALSSPLLLRGTPDYSIGNCE